jgi:hypothetical protein
MKLLETLGEEVCNPKSWEGINGFEVELEFKNTIPDRVKPKVYSIPPALFDKVRDEVGRLCKTIWEPSKSPIASPMVVAAKATPPFVRWVGDYRVIN